jgi:outer membrane protein assembly factor BamD (BamD/ComL family)
MGRKRIRHGKHVHFLVACIVLIGLAISGCTGLQEIMAKPEYRQADDNLALGNYQAALGKYGEVINLYPQAADGALFGIGCIYADPQNPERDYKKSADAFRKLVAEYPKSRYREPSEVALALLGEMTKRDRGTAALKKQVESLEKQIETLQKQIEQMKEIDRSLEEKRRAVPQRR